MRALVTGARRGIGRAIAEGLRSRGYEVWDGVRRAGADVPDPVVFDLKDPIAVEIAARALLDSRGPVDVLVNDAAVLLPGEGLDGRVADFVESMNVNLTSAFALMKVFGPPMKDRGSGHIVNVSSGWGAFAEGLEGSTAYSVSKAGLNALTIKAARGLGHGVKVNACCPGWVRTEMGGASAERSPEEGADTPLWLATLSADGPTGGFFRDRAPIPW